MHLGASTRETNSSASRRLWCLWCPCQVLMKASLAGMIGVTVLCLVRTQGFTEDEMDKLADVRVVDEEYEWLRFKEDSPLVLYLATVEMLICGSCAVTAAAMYQRRGYQMEHPENKPQQYMKVELSKKEGELYGLGFRPSSDGLECLVVEDVRGALQRWNRRALEPSPEELVEEALEEVGPDTKPKPQVSLGSTIVAVNEVYADVGLMQQQLLSKSQVTLWLTESRDHPSDFESSVFAGNGFSERTAEGSVEAETVGAQAEQVGTADADDADDADADGSKAAKIAASSAPVERGPRFACVAMEDEEPQILTSWAVCSLMFGWVTMLPILLMQPHEERPRQQLFRQFLLKPSFVILPLWLLLWFVDCIQLLFMFQLIHPFYFFLICHSVLPAIMTWHLFTMQVADERIILDQRKSRAVEAGEENVIEDPQPVFLKELIMINPVALVGLGASASIPILLCSLFTVFETRRLKVAQSYVNVIYGSMTILQLVSMYFLYHLRFAQLPEMYLAGFYFLLSIPCFAVWCICILCAGQYAKKDLFLVQSQRLERAKELARKDVRFTGTSEPSESLVDCTEALTRAYVLIYTV
ncbi:unnamed protein product [Durusdinium trenchii]|uniref:Transmembrane protein n=1 Tax=Durusdinium trenchii TaxID=1381693 RepID=A0ABP0KMX9_9DINO